MRYVVPIACVALTACAPLPSVNSPSSDKAGEATTPAPPPNARAVEEFDTTTKEERIAATQTSSGGKLVGTTVATLGDPSQPGFWIETPLIKQVSQGRVRFPETGKSVDVELRPITGGSSRVSLAALRLLEVSLTDLVSIEVYTR